jgi:hypothetical protein
MAGEREMTTTRTARVGLAALAVSAGAVGFPALLAPRSFFSDFPFVAHWVDRLGFYNEHLTTDVGTLYLVIAALFAWSAVTGSAALAFPLCVTWTAAGTVHLVFHIANLDGFPTADAIAQSATLALVPIVSAVLIWLMLRAE